MAEPQFDVVAPGANPAIQQYLSGRKDGNSMRALKVERDSLIASLRSTGQARPATILNFNPVALRLEGGINFKVPSVIDESVPEESRFKVTYKGRTYKASVLTVRDPIIFPQIKDVKKIEDVEVGEYIVKACKQIEIVHNFLASYTDGTPSSSGMGGVICFEGDRHALKQRNQEKLEILVPTYVPLPNKTREYFTEPKEFSVELARSLDRQKAYCDNQCQLAQSMWDDEDQRKNITDVHRIWAQFSLDMGWRQSVPIWLTAQNESEETCEGCGAGKKRATAFFCHACARPYSPLKAYMAGELGIESVHLNRIKPEEWVEVRKEEARRKKLREGI